MNLQQADLSGVTYFVLDEADRMLDMGFQEDIMQINSALPKDCQRVMFSATMPPKIKKFARTILHNPRRGRAGYLPPAREHRAVRLCLL